MKTNLTTLCYVEKDGQYLMMHRIKKKNDVNQDKWVGIGGHVEEGESPEECLLREAKEETNLTLTSYALRGVVTFTLEGWGTEYMFLYTADGFTGEIGACNEGVLEWIDKEEVCSLPIWEGDRIFFDLLNRRREVFSLKLIYRKDVLMRAILDGNIILK